MSKKVVLTLDDDFYQEFKDTYGRPGKPMTQIILDKMYELLKDYTSSKKFYEHIDQCLAEVDAGNVVNLGQCTNATELLNKIG